MKEILLIGGGGHCKSVIDVIENSGEFKVAGIIDKEENLKKINLNYEIIGTDLDLPALKRKFDYALITIGHISDVKPRVRLFILLKELGFILPVIISPRAYISKHATLDEGTVIMHDSFINASAKIGKNCIINTKAVIEHDAAIGDNCHISTGAVINGGVIVGNNTFVGSNATTKEYIKIPENSFLKAGSVTK